MKKYIINFSEDSNKTIVTRYLKENFLMKSKFFILLYSIYLIYVRVYIYKFNLDISLMKKVSLETSFHFLVLYFIILLVKSKKIMILEKEEIIIKIDIKENYFKESVVSYGVEIYYDKKQKLLFNTCLENEAIEIIKTLKIFIKGEKDEKIYSKYFRG